MCQLMLVPFRAFLPECVYSVYFSKGTLLDFLYWTHISVSWREPLRQNHNFHLNPLKCSWISANYCSVFFRSGRDYELGFLNRLLFNFLTQFCRNSLQDPEQVETVLKTLQCRLSSCWALAFFQFKSPAEVVKRPVSSYRTVTEGGTCRLPTC